MRRGAGSAVLLLVALAAFIVAQDALADPFRGRPAPDPAPPADADWMPGFLGPVLAWLIAAQRDLIDGLHAAMTQFREQGGMLPVLTVVGGAFVYGVLHAAGPGHGKVVVAAYFLSRGARLRHALAMSGAMAVVQGMSAVLLVGLLVGVLNLGSAALSAGTQWLEAASFGLIGALGLLMAGRAILGKDPCCIGNDHGDEHHHHHHHHHGHHHHGHDQSQQPAREKAIRQEILAGAVSVGIRPCSGAILLLLFTFANGLAWLGIAGTAAMAIGSAITVAMVAAGAWGGRAMVQRLGVGEATAAVAGRAAAIAGGGAIGFIGLAFMATSVMVGPSAG